MRRASCIIVSVVRLSEKSRFTDLDLEIDRLRALYPFIDAARIRRVMFAFQRFSARAATISRISHDAPLLIAGKPAVVMCTCLRVLHSGITIGGRVQSYYRLLISESIDLYARQRRPRAKRIDFFLRHSSVQSE